jgi:hypothetical protein
MAMKFFRAANLPAPMANYSQEQFRQLVRSLELYFSQMDSQTPITAEYFQGHGEYIINPCGLFYDTTTQTLATADTATPVEFDTTYITHDISVAGANNSQITVAKAGIYNFQFTATIESTNSSAKDVYMWINRNGTDVGYSARPYTISGSGTERTFSFNFNIDLQAEQYIELEWASPDTTVTLAAKAASAPYPEVASAVLTVNFVSSLEDVTVGTLP